ncbi:MAG: RNA pseudouridine synthase, partial [Thiovulaceae bacterium]|nr:RNA pseudouridine synthase [Sulfurimonadaceae bacterium]
GLLVHPSSMKTPYCLLDEVKYHFGDVANITHRIDQETSGLVLISRDKEAEIALKTAFEDRKVVKSYLALVKGNLKNSLSIDEPISRHLDQDSLVKIMVRIAPEGKPSSTKIIPLKYYEDLDMTLVEAWPKTGRQHQIRIHLFHVGHPIIGDPLYNVPIQIASDFLERKLSPQDRIKYSQASRLLLHAKSLEFVFKEQKFLIESTTDFEAVCLNILEESKNV